ncbi:MAG: DNA-binding transcriptional regulator OxyR [Gammaproteobacteria bacterium]|nr:DNA-binding transcriptional regulator OxyR [Gammaproteobacteria bacterium]
MNIRDLQYLVAVYELQSFSKAADRCYVSQPTLSGQLKKLEEGLGVTLIERSTRRVLFTPVGEKVVEQARHVLSTVEQIKTLAREDDDPMAGDFHIGLIPTIGPFLLPEIIPDLSVNYPDLKLFLYELQTATLIDKLARGELDAAILARLDWDYPIQEIPLYQEQFKLAVSTTDPLARLPGPVPLSALDGRSVLMLEDGHCLRDQALGVCFSAGATEDNRFQATSMSTLLQMVAIGAGITLIPELASKKPVSGVSYLSFAEPAPSREVILASRRSNVRELTVSGVATQISATVAAAQGVSKA